MLDTIVNKAVEPVRWLIIAAIAYSLATTIWTFFATPISVPNQTPQGIKGSNTERAPTNLNWILSKHLFGEAGAAPVNNAPQQQAVQTRLPLELHSVFMADVKEDSTAIIAQKGKPGLLYKIDATIPGNAKLVEVHEDRVILRRAGINETLGFPKSKLQVQSTSVETQNTNGRSPQVSELSPSATPGSNTGERPPPPNQAERSTADIVGEYSTRFNEDAQGTLDELGIEGGTDGGYKLGANAQSGYLRQTGLQPGDVIMSINGTPVGNVEQDQQQLQSIMAQGSARIEVQRGSRRFFITVSLK